MARRLDQNVTHRNIAAGFTPWIKWSARKQFDVASRKLHTYGGVYLLAHFEQDPPPAAADPLHDNIVYVGEANNLGKRWSLFERAALHDPDARHSGGRTYRRWRTRSKADWSSLHVAALPCWFEHEGNADLPSSMARRFRLYMEQHVLWQLIQRRDGRTDLHLLNVK